MFLQRHIGVCGGQLRRRESLGQWNRRQTAASISQVVGAGGSGLSAVQTWPVARAADLPSSPSLVRRAEPDGGQTELRNGDRRSGRGGRDDDGSQQKPQKPQTGLSCSPLAPVASTCDTSSQLWRHSLPLPGRPVAVRVGRRLWLRELMARLGRMRLTEQLLWRSIAMTRRQRLGSRLVLALHPRWHWWPMGKTGDGSRKLGREKRRPGKKDWQIGRGNPGSGASGPGKIGSSVGLRREGTFPAVSFSVN